MFQVPLFMAGTQQVVMNGSDDFSFQFRVSFSKFNMLVVQGMYPKPDSPTVFTDIFVLPFLGYHCFFVFPMVFSGVG